MRLSKLGTTEIAKTALRGKLVALSPSLRSAEIQAVDHPDSLANLVLRITTPDGIEIADDIYAKVSERSLNNPAAFRIDIASLSEEVQKVLGKFV